LHYIHSGHVSLLRRQPFNPRKENIELKTKQTENIITAFVLRVILRENHPEHF